MLRTGWAVLAFLIGCGDSDECGFEDATFLGTYEKLNGDCPEREPRLFVPSEVPADCEQDYDYDDSCGVRVIRRCDSGDQGLSVVKVEPEGRDYVGTAQYTIYGVCAGLYRVRFSPR